MKKLILSAILLAGLGAAGTASAGVSFGVSIDSSRQYARYSSAPVTCAPVVAPIRADNCAPTYTYDAHRALHQDVAAARRDLHEDLGAAHDALDREIKCLRAQGVPERELKLRHDAGLRQLRDERHGALLDLKVAHREGHYELGR
jgi:hypothetical protein